MGTIYHVVILVLQLKPQYTYWNLDSIMSRGKGQAPLRARDTQANASGLHTLGNPGSVGPVLTYVRGLFIPEHTFPGPYRPISEAPRIQQPHR